MTGPFSEHLKEDLYHCLKCGMCQQVCPTFRVMKQEYFAPRGRVQIIKHYLEGDLRVSPVFQKAVMSCMLCDACGAMCPSGVRIEQVFRNMRREIASVIGPGLKKRALFTALQGGSLMRAGARVAGIGQKLLADTLNVHWKIGNIPLHQLPRFNPWAFRRTVGEKITPRSSRRGRVIYFTGCGTDLVYSDVGMAVADVLVSLG
ncbi:MAG: (Fe-S)-binding protein, partial [Deltaproteobacteria bacterium]|nr:(Fe-S)-binding protein [Deltaproteobacteria bacterium]